ncbi:MAG: GGDEF domain-containing protein [Desulfobacterales bacterium]|nr:GGDEF domain-containing protein [Desulfobacterales bacterium]
MTIKNLSWPSKEEVNSVLEGKIDSLPIIPIVIIKLLKLINDEKSSISDLEKLIETDQVLSAKLLKMVNAASFGIRQQIYSIRQAISYLGFSQVRSIALELALYDHLSFKLTASPFDRIFFWRHSLSVACLSRILAEVTNYSDPNTAYICGLLHDLGKIVFDVYGKITYREFIKNLPRFNGLLIEEESKILGISHNDIGAYFCRQWDLPEKIVLAVKLHHNQFSHIDIAKDDALLISIISVSNFITWTQGIGSVDILRHPILQPEIKDFIDLSNLDIHSLIVKMDKEIKSIAHFYNFIFPSTDRFRENLLKANIILSQTTTKYYYNNLSLIHQKNGNIKHIKESLIYPHHSLDRNVIIKSTLEAINKDLSFDRLYYMQIDKKSRCLVIKEILDTTEQGTNLLNMHIPIESSLPNFITCLRNKTPVCMTGSTLNEHRILHKMGIKEIAMIPVTNNNQIIGIIGIDNIESNRPISDIEISAISIVANELGMAIEHALLFEKYRTQASIDPLTKINNRGAIDELLSKSFKNAKETNSNMCVTMIDIDYFKKFNDTFGHQTGDNVLKLIASVLSKYSRPTDHLGRYGGEEFVIILNDTDFESGIFFGERLRKNIELLGKMLVKRFKGIILTVSVGIATMNPNIKTKEELLEKADKALYQAKERGRNRVVGYMELEK